MIAREFITDKQRAILHYADLENYNYPAVFLASPATVYSDAGGDGYVGYDNTPDSWNTSHDSANGTGVVGTQGRGQSQEANGDGSRYIIRRGFVPFDTSGIGSDNIATDAVLSLYEVSSSDSDNDGDDWINIVQTTQASLSSLDVSDYSKCGDAVDNPTEGSTRKDLGTLTTSEQYYNWTLNSTGLRWVNVTGNTLLGVREGHDCVDSPIANGTSDAFTFYSSEESGTSKDPKLVVTYIAYSTIYLPKRGRSRFLSSF